MTFGDAYALAEQSGWTPEVSELLHSIDARLSRMMAVPDYDGWDASALDSSMDWREIRGIADATLTALGIIEREPIFDQTRYVVNGPSWLPLRWPRRRDTR